MDLLKDLELFAQGGQAEIYLYGDDRVLRVLRNPQDRELLLNEIEVMKSLYPTSVCVPKVYEFLTVDGRPSVVVERIFGDSMLLNMQKHPWRIISCARELASLHISLARHDISRALDSIGERARALTSDADLLSPHTRDFVCGLIYELPDGDDLCHGDFHPGNILQMEQELYY